MRGHYFGQLIYVIAHKEPFVDQVTQGFGRVCKTRRAVRSRPISLVGTSGQDVRSASARVEQAIVAVRILGAKVVRRVFHQISLGTVGVGASSPAPSRRCPKARSKSRTGTNSII